MKFITSIALLLSSFALSGCVEDVTASTSTPNQSYIATPTGGLINHDVVKNLAQSEQIADYSF